MNHRQIHIQVAYALLAAAVLMIITGLGITEPEIITPISFGLFTKFISQRIHFFLWGPFCILFIIHIWLVHKKMRG